MNSTMTDYDAYLDELKDALAGTDQCIDLASAKEFALDEMNDAFQELKDAVFARVTAKRKTKAMAHDVDQARLRYRRTLSICKLIGALP